MNPVSAPDSTAVLASSKEKSPCDSPCSSPCSEGPCDEKESLDGVKSGFADVIHTGFQNGIKVCFDELLHEPRRILLIGGCRQREFARYLGFLLPATDIVVLDYDLGEVERAKEEVCCRFTFAHAKTEKLPFADGTFDLTIAHHLFEYVENWEDAMAEIARVTSEFFLFTTVRPVWWDLANGLKSVQKDFHTQALHKPIQQPTQNELFSYVNIYSKIKLKLSPIPWRMYMAQMKNNEPYRTVLE
ncbi:MAG: class I SAM-dependent methyltransferase [Cyanobacteria bacterium]|nr:class I SAM-dependent methyltransferase [Cyanobacteriota bacterium]